MADQETRIADRNQKPTAPVLLGKAHKLTKNGSKGNVENSRGHS